MLVSTTASSIFAVVIAVVTAGKQTRFVTHGRSYSNVVPMRYVPQRTHRRVHMPVYSASEMFHAFPDYDTAPISNHIDDHRPRNFVPFGGGGINPQHLSSILSHLGVNNLDHLHRVPEVAQHLYGTPEKVIIKDHRGPPRKMHGYIQTFHTVKTIDHGGRTLGGNKGYTNSLPEGDFSDYTGYEDFEFPPDW